MIYRLPELKYKDMLHGYVLEHIANGENRISASLEPAASEYGE